MIEVTRILIRKTDNKPCCPHCFKPLKKTKVKNMLVCRRCKMYFDYGEEI